MEKRIQNPKLTTFTCVVVLIAFYFVGGMIGKATSFLSGSVALVWPPAGIALIAILLSDRRSRPGAALSGDIAPQPGRGSFRIVMPRIVLKISPVCSSSRRPGFACQTKPDKWSRQYPITDSDGNEYRRPAAGPMLFARLWPRRSTP